MDNVNERGAEGEAGEEESHEMLTNEIASSVHYQYQLSQASCPPCQDYQPPPAYDPQRPYSPSPVYYPPPPLQGPTTPFQDSINYNPSKGNLPYGYYPVQQNPSQLIPKTSGPPGYVYSDHYYPPPPLLLLPPQQQQQQQQQLVVSVGQQTSPAELDLDQSQNVSMCGAIALSCFVFWCCGWFCGAIAFVLAVIGGCYRDKPVALSLRKTSYSLSVAGIVTGIVIISIYILTRNN